MRAAICFSRSQKHNTARPGLNLCVCEYRQSAVAAAREQGRQEGIQLSPRVAAEGEPPAQAEVEAVQQRREHGRYGYGVGAGQWEEQVLRRKLAAAEGYVAKLAEALSQYDGG